MRVFAFLTWLITMPVALAASEPPLIEKGSPRDLRGVHRVYVESNDGDVRQEIATRLASAMPDIEVVAAPSEAEVMLVVTFWFETASAGATNGSSCTPCEATRRAANPPARVANAIASVVKPAGPNRYRQLMKSTWSGQRPETLRIQIVQQFVSAYRKANR